MKEVIRFDSIPIGSTFYTEEGYLRDCPIVTTCGIFEYANPDGSIRRELRLPEEVFKPESLKTYKGKPVVITHRAGLITKDNVDAESIGTILSEGIQDGDNVRAEIVIHDTESMKKYGLVELSLGYKLTLDETPGEWNGQKYDAVQRNIKVNHLALVDEARAGDEARLNLDGKEKNILTGGKRVMSNINDETQAPVAPDNTPTVAPVSDATPPTVEPAEKSPTDKLQEIRDRKDRRDSAAAPATLEEATALISELSEDLKSVLGLFDEQQAKSDFDSANEPSTDNPTTASETNEDGAETDCKNCDGEDEDNGTLNMDAVDKLVSEKFKVVKVAEKLNMDGEEMISMPLIEAKKAVLRKSNPDIRLDGKSVTYINAAFDIVKANVEKVKPGTENQRKQIFNTDGKNTQTAQPTVSGADAARARMLDGIYNKKKEDN